jgi:hypothetical protein
MWEYWTTPWWSQGHPWWAEQPTPPPPLPTAPPLPYQGPPVINGFAQTVTGTQPILPSVLPVSGSSPYQMSWPNPFVQLGWPWS